MMYRFERGGGVYSVDVHVSAGGTITFYNIKCPEDAPKEVIKQLIADAEEAVIKKVEDADAAASTK